MTVATTALHIRRRRGAPGFDGWICADDDPVRGFQEVIGTLTLPENVAEDILSNRRARVAILQTLGAMIQVSSATEVATGFTVVRDLLPQLREIADRLRASAP